jgi:hypothetical protein
MHVFNTEAASAADQKKELKKICDDSAYNENFRLHFSASVSILLER